MEQLWKVAFAVAGLGGISTFLVWSLYRQWLRLPIFQQMTKEQQFRIFIVFLVLTFMFGLAGLGTYAYVATTGSSQQESKHARGLKLLNRLPSYSDQQGHHAMNRHELLSALKQLKELALGADFNQRIDRLTDLTNNAPEFNGNHYDMLITPETRNQLTDLKLALEAKG